MLSERSERKSSELRSRRHPDYLMRAQWHDYRRPATYLVTFTKDKTTPWLSYVKGEMIDGKAHARTLLKELGILVEKAIKELPALFENLEVLAYAIMPDHVHIVMRVHKYASYTLGRVVAKVKGLVSAAAGRSLWTKGFNDKISFNRDRTENFIRYVNENPLRFYVKSQHPEFFNRRYRIQIQGNYYDIFGNPMLLRHHETRTAGGITRRQCMELNQLAESLSSSGSVYQREYMR